MGAPLQRIAADRRVVNSPVGPTCVSALYFSSKNTDSRKVACNPEPMLGILDFSLRLK